MEIDLGWKRGSHLRERGLLSDREAAEKLEHYVSMREKKRK
jgi:hypothetical protein